ncbi:fatty acyl-AMP ligase [Luedemannella flava]|uniref:Fatty acyl-AMP ligase n=1 Tax=Luedemannella flava TaxID=349316 RepID=A0ABP4XM01_9ACTN
MSYDLGNAPDVVTLFRQRAAERPQQDVVGFLADPDDVRHGMTMWTYEQLDREARGCAEWLQRRLPVGSRVLLLYPNGLEFVAAFVGCLYAGMIAVPAPLPGRHQHHRFRVATIMANADVSAVLTTSAKLGEVREWSQAFGAEHAIVAASDEPGLGDPDHWRPVRLDRSTVALLQYTSGSTGDPKGVIIDHDNILYNLDIAARELGFSNPSRACGWVPLYHDLALQAVLLYALLHGGSALLMEPMTFLRRPVRWLQVIDEHNVEFTFAPNFAYELCLDRVTDEELRALDLSRLRMAGNASEPVNPAVLAAFADRFAPAGFRVEAFAPVYGMAEATGYVSGIPARTPQVKVVDPEALAAGSFSDPQPGQPVREIVSCGRPTRACEVRVVDPDTRQARADGQLGEIWLRGRSISRGYWASDSGAAAFGNSTADGEDGFLRTGDLGVLDDGELYVHGRLKDTLIVRGRNIYPQDVEQELRVQHPDLGRIGAVFASDAGDADALGVVVAFEVTRAAHDRLPALAAEVRHTVGREFGVQVAAVLLLRPGTVQRTTSGKVQRSAMRTLFGEGRIAALYQDPPAPALVAGLR